MNLLSKRGATIGVYQRLTAESWPAPLLGGLTATVAFAIYLATLAPDLTWSHASYDGGELITAGVTLGIPHPPGYPTYVLLGKAISLIPLGTVAFRFNLFSTVSVTLASALLAITIGRLFFSQGNEISAKGGATALAAALTFAYTPLIWSQAIVTEVYGLNLLMLAGFLWALLVRRSYRLSSLFLGLSITTHLTSLFVIPLAIALTPRTSWRTVGVFFLFGLSPLLAIPLLAQTNSPVLWGQPTDLQGWWWLVSGQLYHSNLRFPPEAQHVSQLLRVLLSQIVWMVPLLVLRTWMWVRSNDFQSSTTFSRSETAKAVTTNGRVQSTLLVIALYMAYTLLYHTADALVLLLPTFLFLAILVAPTLWPFGSWALILPIALILFNFSTLNASQDHQVRPLAESVLSAAPTNAILLTPGDRTIFSLWYFHHVENQRPDLILVDSNLFAFPWYRQRLQDQYPDLHGLAADDLLTFRQANHPQHPICQISLTEHTILCGENDTTQHKPVSQSLSHGDSETGQPTAYCPLLTANFPKELS